MRERARTARVVAAAAAAPVALALLLQGVAADAASALQATVTATGPAAGRAAGQRQVVSVGSAVAQGTMRAGRCDFPAGMGITVDVPDGAQPVDVGYRIDAKCRAVITDIRQSAGRPAAPPDPGVDVVPSSATPLAR